MKPRVMLRWYREGRQSTSGTVRVSADNCLSDALAFKTKREPTSMSFRIGKEFFLWTWEPYNLVRAAKAKLEAARAKEAA